MDKLTAKWDELFQAKDVKGLHEMYAEDCKVMIPGYPVIHGREGNLHEIMLFNEFGQFQMTWSKAKIDYWNQW